MCEVLLRNYISPLVSVTRAVSVPEIDLDIVMETVQDSLSIYVPRRLCGDLEGQNGLNLSEAPLYANPMITQFHQPINVQHIVSTALLAASLRRLSSPPNPCVAHAFSPSLAIQDNENRNQTRPIRQPNSPHHVYEKNSHLSSGRDGGIRGGRRASLHRILRELRSRLCVCITRRLGGYQCTRTRAALGHV
jgi:hypothetical protein